MAPRGYRKYLSYITGELLIRFVNLSLTVSLLLVGWLCCTTWQTALAASAFLAGTMIQALFVLNMPDYNFKQWHGSLLVLAIISIAIIFNTILVRKLPLLQLIFVCSHCLGVVIFIPLLVLAPKRPGGAPLIEFYNPNGWISDGVATWVGMLPTVIALIGFDCSVHMCSLTPTSDLIVTHIDSHICS
jgi:Amino acid permease